MAAVVVVHGVGKQYSGGQSLHADMANALIDGVSLSGARPPVPQDVSVAFYGHWFRPVAALRKSSPEWTPEDLEEGLETELLFALWEEAARIAPDRVPPPEPRPSAKAAAPRSVQRAVHAVALLLPVRCADRFLIGMLRQVRLYLTDDEVRAKVLAEVEAAVSDDTRVIVGHSLGSVIAYEALCAHPEWPVRALVTLGSPLGIPRLVFDRLRPRPQDGRGAWPGSVEHWTNLAADGDIVALVKKLGPLFPGPSAPVADIRLHNGPKAHDLLSHLCDRATGAAVAAGLAT